MLKIINRNYSTRNHTSGNNFLLANTGQLITEKVQFTIDFSFISSADNQIQFTNTTTAQLMGGNWFDYGFVVGDSVSIVGSFTIDGTGYTASGTFNVLNIDGDLMEFDSDVHAEITGVVFPVTGTATNIAFINSRTAPESINLLHNIVSNSGTGSEFSSIDGEVNRFEVNGVDAMSVSDTLPLVQLGNKSGGTYLTASIERLSDVDSKVCFETTLTYSLPYHIEDLPSDLTSSQSVKPYYKIQALPQENNPNSALTVIDSIYLGNVGWYNEEHNQGINDFTIESVVLTDVDGNVIQTVDYTQTTHVRAVISSDTPFMNGAEIEFYAIPDIDSIKNNPQSNGQLINLVNSYFTDSSITEDTLGNVTFGGQTLTLDGNSIILEFDIEPNTDFTAYIETLPTEQRKYRLTASVESSGGDANNNNNVSLVLSFGTMAKAPKIGGIFEAVTDEFRDHADNILGASCEIGDCVHVTFVLDGVTYEYDVPKIDTRSYLLSVNETTIIRIDWDSYWLLSIDFTTSATGYYNNTDTDYPIFNTWIFTGSGDFELDSLITTECNCLNTTFQGCTEDDFIYEANLTLQKNVNYKSIEVAVMVDNLFTLQSETINLTSYVMTPNGVININYNNPHVQYLDAPNRNKTTALVSSIGTSDYTVNLSVSLMANWRYWLSQQNAPVEFYDLDLPSNGQSQEWMRYVRDNAHDLKLRVNIIDDTDTEYYYIRNIDLIDYDATPEITSVIQLFDENGDEATALLDGQTMTVTATHTLTDDSNWNESGLWGWISVRPKESEPNKRISTAWTPTNQDLPLKAPCTLEYVAPNIVKVTATIDTSLIISEYSTIICRIEQFLDKNAKRQVHKQEFKKVKLPIESIYEDRGLSFCKEPQLVVASTSDNAWHKNDRTGIAYKFDTMTIQLEDSNGNLTDAPGISITFPNQSDAVGFIIDWRQVTTGGNLAQGCYKVRVNYELEGISNWFYFGSFRLLEYSQISVQKTVRLWVFLNDFVRKQGINYKDSGFCTSIRFRGQFGYMQPKYDTENLILSDRTRNKIRIEALRTYELRSQNLLACQTRQIDEEILLVANQIFISDHNANNHIQYYDLPVILSEEESPQFDYNEGVYAKIKAVFKDKQALSESKYNGNINGFNSPLFELPQPVSGGGICSPATVKNSNNSYNDTVASGSTLTLPNTTLNIYVNGVLNTTTTFVTLDPSEVINITP